MKLTLLVIIILRCRPITAPTEGDTGYDYGDPDDNSFYDESALVIGPSFDVPMANVTVVEGQTAILPCSIEHLGSYKVAWLEERGSNPLTYDERRVTDDFRFSIVRPHKKEWNLQINSVQWPKDNGQYRCTVNTQPLLSKVVTLNVRVAASIINDMSPMEMTISEGHTLTLNCNATGIPRPRLTWKRIHDKDSDNCTSLNSELLLNSGSKFVIHNISRFCGEVYECIADNGVRAPAVKRTNVVVLFAPQVTLPNRRIGQLIGRDTILECVIAARPQVSNYWRKVSDGRPLVSDSLRHNVDVYEEGPNSVILSLRISKIGLDDYGDYQCVAVNPIGQDEKTVTLYEYKENESIDQSINNFNKYSINQNMSINNSDEVESNRTDFGFVLSSSDHLLMLKKSFFGIFSFAIIIIISFII